MSVYTPLTLSEISQFSLNYNLKTLAHEAIKTGIENSNYFVENIDNNGNKGTYVLTIFESLTAEQASLTVALLSHLAGNNIPVAVALRANNEQHIQTLKQKPAQLAPRLIGSHAIQPNAIQTYNIGVMLAKIHQTLQFDFLESMLMPLLNRTQRDSPLYWQQEAEAHMELFTIEELSLLKQIFENFYNINKSYPDLPQGLIHGDLFRDNVLYNGNEITGVLDFSELSKQPLLFDIAITINDFCSNFPDVTLNSEKFSLFLQGYQQIRKLTEGEIQALPTYMAMAACRFWLSRLAVNKKNSDLNLKSEDILKKDPLEMLHMLQARLRNT